MIICAKVSYGASTSILSNKKMYPLFLRTIQPEHTGNPAKLELMKHLGWSRVATIRSTGRVFSEVREACKDLGSV